MKLRQSWKLAPAVIIGFLVLAPFASAHQPRLVSDAATEILNPEVSQAFYGELTGDPAVFRIVADKPFKLYVGILVPDVANVAKDISAEIVLEGGNPDDAIFPYLLDGLSSNWESFHEEFANDDYFWGPEFKAPDSPPYKTAGVEVGPGTYLITVFSPNNYGKYVLVVGEKEEFPFNEIVNTMRIMPTLKSEYFGKPSWQAFYNLTGLFLIAPIVIILLAIALIWGFLKILKGRKQPRT